MQLTVSLINEEFWKLYVTLPVSWAWLAKIPAYLAQLGYAAINL